MDAWAYLTAQIHPTTPNPGASELSAQQPLSQASALHPAQFQTQSGRRENARRHLCSTKKHSPFKERSRAPDLEKIRTILGLRIQSGPDPASPASGSWKDKPSEHREPETALQPVLKPPPCPVDMGEMFHLFSVFPTSEACFSPPRVALLSPPAYKSSNSGGAGGGDGGACGAAGRGSPDDLRPRQPPRPCAPSIQPVGPGSQQSRARMFLQELEPEEGSSLSSPGLAIQTKGHRSPGCGQTVWAASLSPEDQEEKKHQRGAFEKWHRSSRTELPLRGSAGRPRSENGLSSEPGTRVETFRGVQEDQGKTPTEREGDMRTKQVVEEEGCRTDTGEKRIRMRRWTGGEDARP